MPKDYDNTNKGALFGNRNKKTDKHPDLQGKLNIDGAERWISGWFFTYEKDGEKKRGINLALGDAVESREEKRGGSSKVGNGVIEDDVPF